MEIAHVFSSQQQKHDEHNDQCCRRQRLDNWQQNIKCGYNMTLHRRCGNDRNLCRSVIPADLHLHRNVAIKVLLAEFNLDQQAVQRFQNEVRMLSEVQHTNVANLLDSGVCGNTRFIVMGLLRYCRRLCEKVLKSDTLTLLICCRISTPCCRAKFTTLQFIRRSLLQDDFRTQLANVHKDLKFVASSGGIGIFEICDQLANTCAYQPGVTARAELYPIESLQNDTTLQLAAKPLSPETEAQSGTYAYPFSAHRDRRRSCDFRL